MGNRSRAVAVVIALAAFTTSAAAEEPSYGTAELASVSSSGTAGDDNSWTGDDAISGDGRFVAFTSDATNLVSGDTNGAKDAFVRDTVAETTTRVNVSTSGHQSDAGVVWPPSISSDGRWVVFASAASNLIPGDTNGATDIFARDLVAGMTHLVSVDADGGPANSHSDVHAVSDDGRYVAFISSATDLLAPAPGAITDRVYVRDLVAGTTVLLQDKQCCSGFWQLDISGDGTWVAFEHRSSQREVVLVDRTTGEREVILPVWHWENQSSLALSHDGRFVAFNQALESPQPANAFNPKMQVAVRDRTTDTTTLVTRGFDGKPGDGHSFDVSISADGSLVGYSSRADNLVPPPFDLNPSLDQTTHRARWLGAVPNSFELPFGMDTFVSDWRAGTTTAVSQGPSGLGGPGYYFFPALSADGSAIAFSVYVAASANPGRVPSDVVVRRTSA